MKARLLTFCLLLISLARVAWAQPSDIGNANGTLLCPGRSYSFTASSQQSSSGCQVQWTITGGTTLLTNPTTPGIMNVSFTDVPGGVATLKTSFSGCNPTAANGTSRDLTVYIRSVTNQSLGAITLNGSTSGNLEFGSNTPVTLEVPLLAIPRSAGEPNPVTLFAEGYEWTIPAGWLWPDGAVSNGTPRLFNSRSVSNPNRIQVTPPGNTCGTSNLVVRVRAVDTECSLGAQAGYTPTRSAERTLPINCVLPTLTIISNRTPQGGAITLFCGEPLQAEQVRPSTGAIPSGGSFSNYSFTTGGIVNGDCCLTSAAPGLSVTGTGTGTVGLSAFYSRNGAGTTVSATSVTVTVNAQVAQPTLTSTIIGQTLCLPEFATLTATAPGAGQYAWSAPSFLINGNPSSDSNPYITTSGQVTVTVNSNTYQYEPGALKSIKVRTGNSASGCQASNWTEIQAAIGAPNVYIDNVDYEIPSTGTVATINGGGPNTTYMWRAAPSSRAKLIPGNQGQTCGIQGFGRGEVTITVTATNRCGTTTSSVYTYVGGSGLKTMDSFPNPANTSLTVERAPGTEVTICNKFSEPVFTEIMVGEQLLVDTSKWPEGIYYLQTRSKNGVEHQQLRVEHR